MHRDRGRGEAVRCMHGFWVKGGDASQRRTSGWKVWLAVECQTSRVNAWMVVCVTGITSVSAV